MTKACTHRALRAPCRTPANSRTDRWDELAEKSRYRQSRGRSAGPGSLRWRPCSPSDHNYPNWLHNAGAGPGLLSPAPGSFRSWRATRRFAGDVLPDSVRCAQFMGGAERLHGRTIGPQIASRRTWRVEVADGLGLLRVGLHERQHADEFTAKDSRGTQRMTYPITDRPANLSAFVVGITLRAPVACPIIRAGRPRDGDRP